MTDTNELTRLKERRFFVQQQIDAKIKEVYVLTEEKQQLSYDINRERRLAKNKG